MPLVDPRHLKSICGESFDIILQTKRHNSPMSRIQDVYNYSSMNFSTFKDSKRLPESETNLPCHFRRYSRWRSRAPFSLFKLSGESRPALGVPIWEIKRPEIALVNRRECAILGDTFGVPR